MNRYLLWCVYICTLCTGFFCLAIIKGPPNDIYFIIEGPYDGYFTEKVSQARLESLSQNLSVCGRTDVVPFTKQISYTISFQRLFTTRPYSAFDFGNSSPNIFFTHK